MVLKYTTGIFYVQFLDGNNVGYSRNLYGNIVL